MLNSSGQQRRKRFASRLVALLCVTVLAGCQNWGLSRPADDPPPPPVEPVVVEPQPAEPPVVQALPPATLQQVIDSLDRGELEEAETALLSIIDRQPNSRLALRFLEQLQADPIELMGKEHDVLIVQPGDSLSAIALAELGDAMQFFALARYNGIGAPRRMAPGIELRIPRALRQQEAPEVAEVSEPMASVEATPEVELPPGAGLTMAGQSLVDSGRMTQAIALLAAGAEAGNLDADGEQVLANATLHRTEELLTEDNREEALALLNEISALLSGAGRPLLDPGRRQLEAQRLMDEGVRARRAGDLEGALAYFEQGLVLVSDNAEILNEAQTVREVLVAQLHDQALIYYREQELDQAIALWEQVQELAPDFEPAQVYLERSIALRERLRALD